MQNTLVFFWRGGGLIVAWGKIKNKKGAGENMKKREEKKEKIASKTG